MKEMYPSEIFPGTLMRCIRQRDAYSIYAYSIYGVPLWPEMIYSQDLLVFLSKQFYPELGWWGVEFFSMKLGRALKIRLHESKRIEQFFEPVQ